MIVVADTSPLNYLILIGQIHILEPMYGRIALPAAVRDEMLRQGTPVTVRSWVRSPPEWIEVHPSKPSSYLASRSLDLGEKEAISLALALEASALLIDETAGRKESRAHGLHIIGTLGILRDAHTLKLLDLGEAIQRLKATNFHIPSEILAKLLDNGETRRKPTPGG